MIISSVIKKGSILVIGLIVVWHGINYVKSDVSLSGFLQARPKSAGYAWVSTGDTEPRFFWNLDAVSWQKGQIHPEFNLESAANEGQWTLLPGYDYVDRSRSLQTTWKANLKHPDFMALSDAAEGQWIPVTGYRFIYEGDTFIDTVWDPNKRYDDIKVISLAKKDHYKPFPGYIFVDPGNSLKVIWAPGTVNYENPKLVAGTTEGSWKVSGNPTTTRRYYTRQGNEAAWFVGGVATGILLRSL